MGYILTFLLTIQLWWFGVFCVYQRSDLILYMLLSAIYVTAMSTFWHSYYWLVSFIITCLYMLLLTCFYVLIILAYQKASPKQVMKMFD